MSADDVAQEVPGALEDEYGQMDAAGETYTAPELTLECGRVLKEVDVRSGTHI